MKSFIYLLFGELSKVTPEEKRLHDAWDKLGEANDEINNNLDRLEGAIRKARKQGAQAAQEILDGEEARQRGEQDGECAKES